jgi:hypothetical protein
LSNEDIGMFKQTITVIQYRDKLHSWKSFCFTQTSCNITYASYAETKLCMTPWLWGGRIVIPLIDRRNKGLLTMHVISGTIYNVSVFICFYKQAAEQKQTLLKLQTCEYTKDNGLKLYIQETIYSLKTRSAMYWKIAQPPR